MENKMIIVLKSTSLLGCDTRLRGLRVGKQGVGVMHGFRYKSASAQGEEGHEKWSGQPRMVVAPGCGVTTLGQTQADVTSSGLDATGPNHYLILNCEYKHFKAHLPKIDYSHSYHKAQRKIFDYLKNYIKKIMRFLLTSSEKPKENILKILWLLICLKGT